MELKEVAKTLNTEEANDLANFTEIISTLKLTEVDINKFDFESYFLPYLLGEIAKTNVNTAVYIDNFLKVTKSHHIGIVVKDDNGIKLFKLPPLIVDTDISKLDSIAFGTIVSKVKLYSESNPNKANNLLKKVSEVVMENLELGESSNVYIEELIKIFTSYPDRVNAIKIKNNKAINKVIEPIELEEDLFDY